jgi:hypothetical protein
MTVVDSWAGSMVTERKMPCIYRHFCTRPFPRNGVPDPNEDEFYEVVFDEDADDDDFVN